MPAARTRAANQRASSTVATIGAITAVGPSDAVAAIALNCVSSRSGCRRDSLSPRTPSSGLRSGRTGRNGTCLSEPMSNVRTTNRRPPNIPCMRSEQFGLLPLRRGPITVEVEQLGAQEADSFGALGQGRRQLLQPADVRGYLDAGAVSGFCWSRASGGPHT